MNAWDTWGGIYENKSLNETNDPYLRFLSGLKYDEVYRAQHERERDDEKKRILKESFKRWYELEREKIYIGSSDQVKKDAWITKVTPCPEHIEIKNREASVLPTGAGISYVTIQYLEFDKSKWSLGMFFDLVKGKYHPEGVYELRREDSTEKGYGNQCVYDCNGDLIKFEQESNGALRKKAKSAGTADYISPGFPIITPSFWNHQSEDVRPFGYILELQYYGEDIEPLIQKYYEVRPSIYYQNGVKYMNGKEVDW